jgi:hypothetical protein
MREVALLLKLGRLAWLQFSLTIFFASTIGLSIGFLYPVERELDIAMYSSGDVQLVVPFPEDNRLVVESRFREEQIEFLKATSAILAIGPTDLSFGPVEAYVILTNDLRKSPFPEETVLSSVEIKKGEGFVDISADIAKKAGKKVGQKIVLNWGDIGIQELRIRSIYAVRETGFVGVISINALNLPAQFPEEAQVPTLALVESNARKVEGILQDTQVRKEYELDGYQIPVLYALRSQELHAAESHSKASLGLIWAVSILAGTALLGMLLREVATLNTSLKAINSTLHRLGLSEFRTMVFQSITSLTVGAFSIYLGSMLTLWLYQEQILSVGFPSRLETYFWWAFGAIIVLVAVSLIGFALTQRRFSK